MKPLILSSALCVCVIASASGQSLPPPVNEMIFCGQQGMPDADSYELIFDGGAPEPLTMDAQIRSECPTGQGLTHSFVLPPARFTLGTHTIQVRGTNAFGSTDGPIHTVMIGVAPGPFSIGAVLAQ